MDPDEWPKVKLADVCKSVDYGYTAAGSTDPIGPKFLRITDIVSGTIDWNAVPFCQIDGKDAKRFGLHHGDVVIARTGATTGVSAYIAEPPDAVFASYLVRLQVGSDADPRFISYFLKSPHFWSYMRGVLGDKSAQPNASARTMTQVTLRLPRLAEQRAVAHVLGTLDDKIELNRRMNETLEAIARAIFRSWFVDFDPIRAKAEGRTPPGMDAETGALFPESFEESALGKIPKGWRVGSIGAVARNAKRGVHQSEIEPQTPYIALEHMPRGSIALSEWANSDGITSGKFRFRQGEILFGKLRPYFHKVGVAPVDGVCSTDIVVITPAEPSWFGFLLGHISSDEFVAYTNAVSTGTKMPRTNWNDMARYEVVVPTEAVGAAFDSLVRPLVDRIRLNVHESRTLAEIRDTLLPKLISGEIRVKDAEHF